MNGARVRRMEATECYSNVETRRIASIVLKAVRDKPPPVLICPCPWYSESYEVPVIIGMFHARRISRFFFSLLPCSYSLILSHFFFFVLPFVLSL